MSTAGLVGRTRFASEVKFANIIAILIVVGIAANSVLIPQSWGQPPAPPAEQEDASHENQDRPTAIDARRAPLPKPDETAKVEIFAIEYEPIEVVTGPKSVEPPARNKKFAFGGRYPFDRNVYAHQKPLFVVTKEHVQYCKLKSRVHNPIDRTRRIVLGVGFTKEAQAELSRRIRALKPGKKTRWSVRLDGDKWWGEEPFPAGGVISGVDVCATLDQSAEFTPTNQLAKNVESEGVLSFPPFWQGFATLSLLERVLCSSSASADHSALR